MASFKEYEDAIEFMIRKYQGPLSVILDELVEAEYANGEQTVSKWANALTKFWCNVTGKVEGSNQIDINYNVSTKLVSDSGFKNEYDKVKVSFENGINSSLF